MNYCLHMRFILWGFSILFPISIFAQAFIPPASKPETRWGIVPPADLDMKTYKLDPDAAAVILWDHGDWVPENWEKGRVRLFRHIRIKILKEEGLTYAQQQIHYKKGEKLGGFRAQTINWDSDRDKETIIKLDPKSLAPDKEEGESITRSFEFPDVQVGSIIEYRYSLVVSEFDELKPWVFQSEIPTRWSEVVIRGFQPYQHRGIPTGLKIRPLKQGVWRAKFLSAFPKETFSDYPEQYRAAIRFFLVPPTNQFNKEKSLEDTWRNVRERLQFNTFLDPDEQALQALYSMSQDLVKDAITDEEKISIIHKHLCKYIKWDGTYELWVKKNPAQVYKSHTGNGTEVKVGQAF